MAVERARHANGMLIVRWRAQSAKAVFFKKKIYVRRMLFLLEEGGGGGRGEGRGERGKGKGGNDMYVAWLVGNIV